MARAFGCRQCSTKAILAVNEKHSAVTERLLERHPFGVLANSNPAVGIHTSSYLKQTFYTTPYKIPKMECGNCKKESQWLEIVGSDFICHKCIGKNKIMGLILRTHMDTFNLLVKKLKIKDYNELIKVTQEEIEKAVDLKQHGIGIFLKKKNDTF